MPPLDQADFDALRAVLREELEPIRASLHGIERKLSLLPDLLFLYDSAVAQEVCASPSQGQCPATDASRGPYGAWWRARQASCGQMGAVMSGEFDYGSRDRPYVR